MDRRKKGCINFECDRFIRGKKHYRYKATDNHCSHCGDPLVFVCAKCFKEIDDKGPNHKFCLLCEAKKDKKIEGIKEKAVVVKDLAKDVGGVVKGTAKTVKEKSIVTREKIAEKATDVVTKEEIQDAVKKVVDNEKVQNAAKDLADDAKEIVKQRADELADVAVDVIKDKIKKHREQ